MPLLGVGFGTVLIGWFWSDICMLLSGSRVGRTLRRKFQVYQVGGGALAGVALPETLATLGLDSRLPSLKGHVQTPG